MTKTLSITSNTISFPHSNWNFSSLNHQILLSNLLKLLSFVSGNFFSFSYGSSSAESTTSYDATFISTLFFFPNALNISLPALPFSVYSKNFTLNPLLLLKSLSSISYFSILRFVSQWSVTMPRIVSSSYWVASSILKSLIPIALPYGKNYLPNSRCFISSLISSKSFIRMFFIIF